MKRSLWHPCHTCWKQTRPCATAAGPGILVCSEHERLSDWIRQQQQRLDRIDRFSRYHGISLLVFMLAALALWHFFHG